MPIQFRMTDIDRNTLTSMIFFKTALNLSVRASAFLFSKLWPFCAPFSLAFIWPKALYREVRSCWGTAERSGKQRKKQLTFWRETR